MSKEVYVPFEIDLGQTVKVTIPKLGDKKRIIELSERNAKYYRQEQFKQIKIVRPDLMKLRPIILTRVKPPI